MEKKAGPGWLVLALITASAGLLLGVTNAVTGAVIQTRAERMADVERAAVFPGAETFRKLDTPQGAAVTDCREVLAGGAVTGYVCQASERGYGGEVQVTVGIDLTGTVTGISVGGPHFAETAGLGAKVKEAAFTEQFAGKSGVIGLRTGEKADGTGGATWDASQTDGTSAATQWEPDEPEEQGIGSWDGTSGATEPVEEVADAETYIDGVSGATYSSMAVVRAVNGAMAYVKGLF